MNRVVLVVCVLFSCLLIQSMEVAKGDPPDLLRRYLFLPRHSTLEQTGGIAGINVRYGVYGRFDLVTGWEYLNDPPLISIHPYAKFENVNAWASNPLLDSPPLDLDQILNLSGLMGSQLPVAAPFDVFKFEGKTADGSAVNLFAGLIGQWLYLRGGTEPPEGSADFFSYQISALARQRPFADFNGDDIVDAADYVMLRHLDPAGSGVGIAGNDDVTAGAGFAEWMQQFGETVPDMTAMDSMMSVAMGSLVTTATVPEPASVNLAILGGLILASLRRRSGFVVPVSSKPFVARR